MTDRRMLGAWLRWIALAFLVNQVVVFAVLVLYGWSTYWLIPTGLVCGAACAHGLTREIRRSQR